MIELTRRADFSASHYYHNPAWSAEENARVFGKCANLNGHGHNYIVEVTVTGEVDPVTGFVVDLKELKEILEREVVEPMDHGLRVTSRADSSSISIVVCHSGVV